MFLIIAIVVFQYYSFTLLRVCLFLALLLPTFLMCTESCIL